MVIKPITARYAEVRTSLSILNIAETPTAFYSNISRTLENKEKCFYISNEIQCVTYIHNRVGCTCLDYCLDGPKQVSFNVSEKCAQLLHCEV